MAAEATQGQAEAGETTERRGTGSLPHQHQLSSGGPVASSSSSAWVGQASSARLACSIRLAGTGPGQQDRVAPRVQLDELGRSKMPEICWIGASLTCRRNC
jgi:hypothetical protein